MLLCWGESSVWWNRPGKVKAVAEPYGFLNSVYKTDIDTRTFGLWKALRICADGREEAVYKSLAALPVAILTLHLLLFYF